MLVEIEKGSGLPSKDSSGSSDVMELAERNDTPRREGHADSDGMQRQDSECMDEYSPYIRRRRLFASLFATKPLARILDESDGQGGEPQTLKRTLTAVQLIALGIGAIIGAGLFSLTGPAAAQHAGPAIMFSFLLAAVGCTFAGLCYSEFATMIPVAGSAYTYSYATMGELFAWVIGWDLVLEYAVGAATVATSWSRYVVSLLHDFGISFPMQFAAGPLESIALPGGVLVSSGIINLPAIFIVCAVSLLLMLGIQESARVNTVIVVVKVTVIILFIGFGWAYVNPENHVPLVPDNETGEFGNFGWSGIVRGAGVIFFAYIGFDAVSTAAQEAQRPQRDMPIGIIGSLVVCTLLYVLFSYVLTGIVNYKELNDPAAVAIAIDRTPFVWLRKLIKFAIIAGYTSVILVMLLGQSRVFFSMARDGLLPKIFCTIHPKWQTPYCSNLLFMAFVSLMSGFLPLSQLGEATSIGTLFAFVLVCGGIIVMRKTHPTLERPFKTPLVPLVPILGIAVNFYLMVGLGAENWLRLFVWMAIGMVVYFGYGRKHSRLRATA
jgi:APA family basic amino acid/polyamine antiporter